MEENITRLTRDIKIKLVNANSVKVHYLRKCWMIPKVFLSYLYLNSVTN
jgi:hypothetical protein